MFSVLTGNGGFPLTIWCWIAIEIRKKKPRPARTPVQAGISRAGGLATMLNISFDLETASTSQLADAVFTFSKRAPAASPSSSTDGQTETFRFCLADGDQPSQSVNRPRICRA